MINTEDQGNGSALLEQRPNGLLGDELRSLGSLHFEGLP